MRCNCTTPTLQNVLFFIALYHNNAVLKNFPASYGLIRKLIMVYLYGVLFIEVASHTCLFVCLFVHLQTYRYRERWTPNVGKDGLERGRGTGAREGGTPRTSKRSLTYKKANARKILPMRELLCEWSFPSTDIPRNWWNHITRILAKV